jgi:hypothetical protein
MRDEPASPPHVPSAKEALMDQRDKREDDLPNRDQEEIEREAEKSKQELDDVPEPGSDPLHEGP